MEPITTEDIKVRVADYFRKSPALQTVKGLCDEYGLKPYLFGGAIRDLVTDRQPRDLDVIVIPDPNTLGTLRNGDGFAQIGIVLQKYQKHAHQHPTPKYGGETGIYRTIEGVDVDLWHIRAQIGSPNNISEVPTTTFLTIESVVASIDHDASKIEVHDSGFLNCMNTGLLDCRPENERLLKADVYAVKTLVLKNRLNLKLSSTLKNWCREQLQGVTLQELAQVQTDKYGDMPLDGTLYLEYLFG